MLQQEVLPKHQGDYQGVGRTDVFKLLRGGVGLQLSCYPRVQLSKGLVGEW